jgi:universal bacterial protein YeaZ
MLTLAFESSAKAASVCLARDEELIAQYTQCSALTHSKTLLPMAEDMLKNTEISLNDVDIFAVAKGPGSFTGIRIGIATVKGLAWSLDKPCIGVSTLEAMAWHGIEAGGYICPVMDARRNQVYNSLFEIKNGKPERLCDDRAISISELISDIKRLPTPPLLVGDGAQITSVEFDKAGIEYRMAPNNLVMQSAWGVAMASLDKESCTSAELLPVYLRLSQAERERQEKMAASEN